VTLKHSVDRCGSAVYICSISPTKADDARAREAGTSTASQTTINALCTEGERAHPSSSCAPGRLVTRHSPEIPDGYSTKNKL
jgi:hypothetical protein